MVVFQPFLRFNRMLIEKLRQVINDAFQPFLRFNLDQKYTSMTVRLMRCAFQPFLRFNR